MVTKHKTIVTKHNTQIVTKHKMQNVTKKNNFDIAKLCRNSNCDETQIVTKHIIYKAPIVTKHKTQFGTKHRL